ncbi:MAG: hypothetical protein Q9218_002447 [Villophora microphyllina]
MAEQQQKDSPSGSLPILTWSPSPTNSILLISPKNEILLLRRVKKSSAFASAHVFPGGHIDPEDGALPPQADVRLHEDNQAYRIGAIRECFEESGILLAKSIKDPSSLLPLDDRERDLGRHAVHNKEVRFQDWVQSHGGIPDTESLYPFTRWLTPFNIPKRFSTQMYLYFLPLAHPGIPQTLHIPTSDGGVEHTEAQFLPATEWLDLARAGQIILFPPQFFLLSLVGDFLTRLESGSKELGGTERLQTQRDKLLEFIKSGDPPWGEKCISPSPLKKKGKRLIMGLDEPGPELKGTDRRGDAERVIRVHFKGNAGKGKEGTSGLEVGWRKDVAEHKEYLETLTRQREGKSHEEGMKRAMRGGKENL